MAESLLYLARTFTRTFNSRYHGVPSAVLLPQVFLAFGWIRAAVAHGLEGAWWSGDEIMYFVEHDTSAALGIYQPFLDHVVEGLPAVTAAIVLLAEILVGLMLAFNYRPLWAIAFGAFLNLQFILAGVVNPSTFYLVIALVIVLWRIEATVSLTTSRMLTRRVAVAAGITSLLLLPFVGTPTPANAIEDPALVLIFLNLLFASAIWWTSHRIAVDRSENSVVQTI